ncbi:MAG: Txe/YoeB family addiction module toxin [Proteobacteria bacterium]|nr:Txe/YoeB family addiction module toxin [Pseudomonadota bacterium]
MDIQFTPTAWAEFQELRKLDRKLFSRTLDLIEAVTREPFAGIGKPEPLRHQLAGCWSRRINDRHRLVYRVNGRTLVILSCIYHYGE